MSKTKVIIEYGAKAPNGRVYKCDDKQHAEYLRTEDTSLKIVTRTKTVSKTKWSE